MTSVLNVKGSLQKFSPTAGCFTLTHRGQQVLLLSPGVPNEVATLGVG